jgi:hypothetical protein
VREAIIVASCYLCSKIPQQNLDLRTILLQLTKEALNSFLTLPEVPLPLVTMASLV